MLIIFTGYTAAGKTTYEDLYLKSNPEAKKLVTITTRPKRKKEKDGVDYHFMTDSQFELLKLAGDIISPREYKTIEDGNETIWKYGIKKEELSIDQIYTTILDPSGILDLVEYTGKRNIKIVYLYSSDAELFRRAAFRGDEAQEFIRRLASDKDEFPKIKNLINLSICTEVDDEEVLKNIDKIKKLLEG
jgi:guanylate kinase